MIQFALLLKTLWTNCIKEDLISFFRKQFIIWFINGFKEKNGLMIRSVEI